MADAFIQAGIGEIRLQDILARQDRAFWPRAEQEIQADMHEERNPGVTVRRPWETEEQHKARLKERATGKQPEAKLGMSRDRAEPQLRQHQVMLAGLTPDHPDYDELFVSWARTINQLEEILGLSITKYTKGITVKRKEDEPLPDEMRERLRKYVSAKDDVRRKLIVREDDRAFLALVRDNEVLPELQTLAVQKLAGAVL